MTRLVGFRVRILADDGTADEDDAWETMLGGGECIDDLAAQTGAYAPGKWKPGEIILRGAMTDKRSALCDWINETVNGKPWRRNLTITELLSVDGAVVEGRTHAFEDCVITKYVFPKLSTGNTTGNVMEEVRIRPVRCELK